MTALLFKDGDDNAENAGSFNRSEQYVDFANLARMVSNRLGDQELSFTGHSQGGGQCQIASLATGGRCISFNAAPLSSTTLVGTNTFNSDSFDSMNIINYHVKGDPATASEHITPTFRPGEQRLLPDTQPQYGGAGDGIIDRVLRPHSIDTVIDALDPNYDENKDPNLREQQRLRRDQNRIKPCAENNRTDGEICIPGN